MSLETNARRRLPRAPLLSVRAVSGCRGRAAPALLGLGGLVVRWGRVWIRSSGLRCAAVPAPLLLSVRAVTGCRGRVVLVLLGLGGLVVRWGRVWIPSSEPRCAAVPAPLLLSVRAVTGCRGRVASAPSTSGRQSISARAGIGQARSGSVIAPIGPSAPAGTPLPQTARASFGNWD